MENIDEIALYFNGKVSTTYALLGLGYGRRACQGFQRPPLTPMGVFKPRRYKSQADNQDLYILDPH
jgi:hypothetical protein